MRTLILTLLAGLLAVPVQAAQSNNTMKQYAEQFGIDINAAYSATRHMETKEGRLEFFVRNEGAKMRLEMNYGGHDAVVISDMDQGKFYTLMPAMSMYREVSMDDIPGGGAGDMKYSEISKAGREQINGFDCNKFKTRFEDKDGGKGGGYMWVSDQGILMKMDMIYQSRGEKGQRMTIEHKDVRIEPQSPDHFQIPSGYTAMSMGLGGMMSQMGGNPYEEPDLGEKLGEAVEDETENAVVEEARSKVREGLGKLFGK